MLTALQLERVAALVKSSNQTTSLLGNGRLRLRNAEVLDKEQLLGTLEWDEKTKFNVFKPATEPETAVSPFQNEFVEALADDLRNVRAEGTEAK